MAAARYTFQTRAESGTIPIVLTGNYRAKYFDAATRVKPLTSRLSSRHSSPQLPLFFDDQTLWQNRERSGSAALPARKRPRVARGNLRLRRHDRAAVRAEP